MDLNGFVNWFNSLSISVDLIFLIIILVFLIGGFIKGFSKGVHKSLFYLIMTIILVALAFVLTPPIVTFVKSMDLTSYNIVIDGVKITSLNDLPHLIESMDNSFVKYLKDTNLIDTVVEMIFAFVSLSIFTGLVSLIWVLGWIIIGPLYHLAFKHLIPKEKRENKRRFIGGIFGTLRALIILSMLLLPYSISDIIIREINQEKHDEKMSFVFDISKAYGNSFIGKMMDFLSIYGEPLDETMLSYLTKMEVNNQQTSLNKEIKVFAKAYNVLISNEVLMLNEGEPSFNQSKLTDEVIEEFVDTIFDSKLANTLLSDSLIIALNTLDYQEEVNIDINEMDKEEIINAIKGIVDWEEEVRVFINIYRQLVNEDNELLDFNLVLNNDEKVDVIASNIDNSTIFKASFPLVFRFLINGLEENGIISNINQENIGNSVTKIRLISDYKSEIETFISIYKEITTSEGEIDDLLTVFEDTIKAELIASKIDDSVIMKQIIPYLVSALINHEEAGDYFASLGVSINDIDVFTEDILWGNEVKIISNVMSLLGTFDVNDLVYDEISSLFSNLKQSKLFAPLLPNIVDHFIDEISTNYDLSEVNDYINLNYLPGLIDYDIKNDTVYFEGQVKGIIEIFNLLGSSGIEFSDNSFVPILEIIRDLENNASSKQDITINEYHEDGTLSEVSIKPTIIKPRALENLVKTIASQDFVLDLLGDDADENLDYDALYNDENELSRLGDIINIFFSQSDLMTGDDTIVASNLNLISSSKLLKPVLPSLIESQINSYLGSSREITVTEFDLEDIDWNKEIEALRFLDNEFVSNTSIEDLNAVTIDNLFAKVRVTNLVSKVMINELNNYMEELDASYEFDKSKLGEKQAFTFNKLLEFKDRNINPNDRNGIRTLIGEFGVFDDTSTYDKELVVSVLPSFVQRINENRTLDKSVFDINTSFVETRNDLTAVVDAIEDFENATLANIEEKAEALVQALNNANDLSSELIVHTQIEFTVPGMAKPYFEDRIINTRIQSIIIYE